MKRREFYTTILITLSLLLLAGCNADPGVTDESNQTDIMQNEELWEKGAGELASSIGNPAEEQIITDWTFMNRQELLQQLGYPPAEGKWFSGHGDGGLGHGISFGTQSVGDKVYVSLIAPGEPIKVERDVRVQLKQYAKRTDTPVLIAADIISVDTVKKEERLFTYDLPDVENTAYVLSAEILSDDGKIEDILISSVYVPVQEINASLTLDENTYFVSDRNRNDSEAEGVDDYEKERTSTKNGTLAKEDGNASQTEIATLHLKNAGPTTLFFGTPYTIEKLVGDTWRVVPLELAFNDIGLLLAPGDTYEQSFSIENLQTGHYRVLKRIHAEGTELEATLAAEFSIE